MNYWLTYLLHCTPQTVQEGRSLYSADAERYHCLVAGRTDWTVAAGPLGDPLPSYGRQSRPARGTRPLRLLSSDHHSAWEAAAVASIPRIGSQLSEIGVVLLYLTDRIRSGMAD